MSQAHTQQSNEVAFDLVVQGVGYLNRVRAVPVRKGASYLACTINAMMGKGDDVQYVGIDCIVVGSIAAKAIEQLRADVEAHRKVIVGFRAGDPRPDFYEVQREGKPERREGLKARLLQLTFAKVDGCRVNIPVVEHKPDTGRARSEAGDDAGVGSACEDGALVGA